MVKLLLDNRPWVTQMVKNLPAACLLEIWVQSLGQGDPLEKEMATPLQYSCLENSMDRGSLVAYSPWGRKESEGTGLLTLI